MESSLNYCLIGVSEKYHGRLLSIGRPSVDVGRDAALCDIALDNALVSRKHARIEIHADGSASITDLGSKFGTFLNGRKVDKASLKDGDKVSFGPGDNVSFTLRRSNAPVDSLADRSQAAIVGTFEAHGRAAAKATTSVPIAPPASREICIGRLSDNDVVLAGPGVSRHHAVLRFPAQGRPVLVDVGSTNGVFVNGKPMTEPRELLPEDWVFIAGFLLRVRGQDVQVRDLSSSCLMANGICQQFGTKRILQGISLAINPREFVGLMGPSGCGKSTLLDALSGFRPAARGRVMVDDVDLYRNFSILRRSIGYVPQRDILYESLTVGRTLHYAAKIRLPVGTPDASLSDAVDEVIDSVGLANQRDTQFRRLSGGQRKRLSLALELITKPSFLFLDEPTSPLDPETTENMMAMFRRLADEGRIVVMVTHKFEKFFEMHHVAILTGSGELAFFGPPEDALRFFDCSKPSEMYKVIGRTDSRTLRERFEHSECYEKYVRSRLPSGHDASAGPIPGAAVQRALVNAPEQGAGIAQWLTLTRRYLEVKLKDRRNTGLLLLQAPAIALVLAAISGDVVNDAKTLFISAVIAIWFGANNAVREIVSESAIYTRERLLNLKIPSYVLSKFAILSGIAVIQCFLFVLVLTLLGRVRGEDFVGLTGILYFTSLNGAALGLLFSGWVGSTEKAMSLLPLLLIPQLLLSGFFKPLDDVYVNLQTGKAVSQATYDSLQRAAGPPARLGINRIEGLGSAAIASALIAARFSFEAIVHWVSIGDRIARDQLATQTFVREYEAVLTGRAQAEIEDSYFGRVLGDLGILALGTVALLLLTMLALKRKDVL